MVEPLPPLYTCAACMSRMFSVDALDLRSDDAIDQTEEDLLIEEAVMDATDLINQYCLPLYPDTELVKSRWVSRRAAYLACHFLSQRRGNPAQYQSQYERILEELKQVQRLQLHIPRIHVRREVTPAMSNLVVDDRYCQDNIRVQQITKLGETYSGQPLDYPRGGCGRCGYL